MLRPQTSSCRAARARPVKPGRARSPDFGIRVELPHRHGRTLTRTNHKLPGAIFWRQFVAQVSNLLYRRIPFGRPSAVEAVRRLEICDTAGWKPALRAFGSRLRRGVCDLSGLTALPPEATTAAGHCRLVKDAAGTECGRPGHRSVGKREALGCLIAGGWRDVSAPGTGVLRQRQ
jgi:hypothetical protein